MKSSGQPRSRHHRGLNITPKHSHFICRERESKGKGHWSQERYCNLQSFDISSQPFKWLFCMFGMWKGLRRDSARWEFQVRKKNSFIVNILEKKQLVKWLWKWNSYMFVIILGPEPDQISTNYKLKPKTWLSFPPGFGP